MENSQRDLDSLLQFIDLARKSGFVNEKTALNRKNAARTILTSVPNIDLSDVTKIDVDDIFQRYVTLAGSKAPPSTLQGQKSHLNSAVKEFRNYVSDRVHYRPSSKIKRSQTIKVATATGETSATARPAEIVEEPPQKEARPLSTPTIHIDFQIHIAPDTDPTLVDKIFESMSKYFPTK
jgi:hypothetical protein